MNMQIRKGEPRHIKEVVLSNIGVAYPTFWANYMQYLKNREEAQNEKA